jgi:hypothetical protein
VQKISKENFKEEITYVDEFVVQCGELVPLSRDGNRMGSGSRLK